MDVDLTIQKPTQEVTPHDMYRNKGMLVIFVLSLHTTCDCDYLYNYNDNNEQQEFLLLM